MTIPPSNVAIASNCIPMLSVLTLLRASRVLTIIHNDDENAINTRAVPFKFADDFENKAETTVRIVIAPTSSLASMAIVFKFPVILVVSKSSIFFKAIASIRIPPANKIIADVVLGITGCIPDNASNAPAITVIAMHDFIKSSIGIRDNKAIDAARIPIAAAILSKLSDLRLLLYACRAPEALSSTPTTAFSIPLRLSKALAISFENLMIAIANPVIIEPPRMFLPYLELNASKNSTTFLPVFDMYLYASVKYVPIVDFNVFSFPSKPPMPPSILKK